MTLISSVRTTVQARAIAARLHALTVLSGKPGEQDVVKLDVPALIRCLEIAREELPDDNSLHEFTEQLIAASKTKGGAPLTAEDIAALPHQSRTPSED